MPQVINFYNPSDPYGEFSNFARFHVWLKKKRWPTAEHYFQAQKFDIHEYQEKIRYAKSPSLAANLGRSRKQKLRRNWGAVKVDVMREVIRAKFTQHDDLKELLLSTGDAKLVEHTANDAYWGDGGDGSGKNMLGIVLMEIRGELQGELREKLRDG